MKQKNFFNFKALLITLICSFMFKGYTVAQTPALVCSHENLNFSTTVLGQQSQFVNVKGSNLLILNAVEDFDITLSGPNADQFRIVTPRPSLVGLLTALLGGGYDIEIVYQPTRPGPHSAVATVTGRFTLIGLLNATITLNGTTISSDVTPPAVVSTAPANGSTGVTTNTAISITYDESVTIANPAGITISGGISATSAVSGNVLTITPGTALAPGTTYTVQVASGAVKDASNNATTTAYQFSFTTAPLTDNTAPVVVSTSPANNASGVAVGTPITITYSEPVSIANASLITMSGGVSFQTAVSGNVLTITPASALNQKTTYQVIIGAGAVKDAANNVTTSSFSISFTTADTTAPVVVSTTPANGSTGATTNTTISITYDEPVTIANASGITISGGISATSSVSGNILTITPGTDLTPGTTYTIQVASGAIKDAANNTTAASYQFSFSTVTVDNTAPVVISTSPANNATGIPLGTPITITYSEPVTIADASLITMSGGATFQTSVSGNVLTITPSSNLEQETTYQVTIGAGAIQDGSDNVTTSSYTFSFTTEDTTAPTVVSASPANGSTGVTTNTNIVITYNEPIMIANAAGITVSGGITTQLSVSGNTLTIELNQELTPDTEYQAQIAANAIQDLAGNETEALYTLSFRTFSSDTNPPRVISTSPANNATGVTLGTPIVITYNEPIFLVDQSLITLSGDITANISVSGNTLTVTPTGTLKDGTNYKVEIKAGAIRDGSGNVTTTGYVLSFTTQDLTPPTVVSTNPANNTSDVDVSTLIYVVYNEPVAIANASLITVTGEDQSSLRATENITIQPIISGNTLIIKPDNVLDPDRAYTVKVASGAIQDHSGNKTTSDLSFSFTTNSDPSLSIDASPVMEFSALVGEDISKDLILTGHNISDQAQIESLTLSITGNDLEQFNCDSVGTITTDELLAGLPISVHYHPSADEGRSHTALLTVELKLADVSEPIIANVNLLGTISGSTGIDNIYSKEIKSEEYYTISGMKLGQPLKNQIYIKKINYTDGTSTTVKLMQK